MAPQWEQQVSDDIAGRSEWRNFVEESSVIGHEQGAGSAVYVHCGMECSSNLLWGTD